jgi:hypothetical protein
LAAFALQVIHRIDGHQVTAEVVGVHQAGGALDVFASARPPTAMPT